MSVECRYHCSRCGAVILEGRTHVEVTCGPVRAAGVLDADFCGECARRFAELVRGAGLPQREPAGASS
jgi:hypothetical protein